MILAPVGVVRNTKSAVENDLSLSVCLVSAILKKELARPQQTL